jgi:hypothetical protein
MLEFIKRMLNLSKPVTAKTTHPDLFLEYIKEMGRQRFNMPTEELDPDIIPGVEIIEPEDEAPSEAKGA